MICVRDAGRILDKRHRKTQCKMIKASHEKEISQHGLYCLVCKASLSLQMMFMLNIKALSLFCPELHLSGYVPDHTCSSPGVTNAAKKESCNPLPLQLSLLPKESPSQRFPSVNNSVTVHLFNRSGNTEFILRQANDITRLHMANVCQEFLSRAAIR